MEENSKRIEIPGVDQLEKELNRVKYREEYKRTLRSTVYILIVVAALAVLVAVFYLPVLRIYGSSMTPALYDGDIVVSVKTSNFESGDIISFYYNNNILVKRVIANPGEWVKIEDDGTVFVNGIELEEPYLEEKALGECDIEFPYQVPEGKVFVIGDHRSVSLDSRTKAIGCVAEEQVVGKLVFRVWPFNEMGVLVNN